MKTHIANLIADLMNEVNEIFLMEYNRQIAREVRLSGTPEELRAFEYVKQTLDGFGLSTKLMFSNAYISLPGNAELRVNGTVFPCITHSMSTPTSDDGILGELVYVSKGFYADYKDIDAKGKTVLIDGLAVPGAVKIAQEMGAAAALFINAKYTHEMIVSPVWGNPTPETVNNLPKIPVVSVNHANGDAIKGILEQSDNQKTNVWLKTQVDTDWRQIPTLIAEIPGSVEPDKYVLFSGHIDSWHYGAMDNGSANATMVEVARILSKQRNKLRRSLRFAFWSGHSHGRYAGSTWYCDQNWEDLYENCVLHVNIDSVGAKGATVLSESNCMAETKDLAASVVGLLANEEYQGTRYGRAGDQSFWGTGTPSIFMGLSEQPASLDPSATAFAQLFGGGKAGGFGWWWHTTEDTLDKIDPEFLKRDCKIYVAAIVRACSEDLIPLNQAAAIQELAGYLKDYQLKVEGKLDLNKILNRITSLEKQVIDVYQLADANALSAYQIHLINDWIMELSRILVPLNYVKGSIFDHDVALKQPPIPSLAELHRLAEVEVGTNEYYMLVTLLTRRINEINFDLKRANRITEELLSNLNRAGAKVLS
ncbi:M28 family peptidase [Fodinisporobacter ferrooxydans]|uniref:M28 family peptidase n=1 Tax=Fodinisporobacter ferrooxydans TaxID=2901836 RepID=A0ABY4CEU3_9BACL|nr:M28 family peptidase [Alicyclobacillaceae bacterium MYW30-H2]